MKTNKNNPEKIWSLNLRNTTKGKGSGVQVLQSKVLCLEYLHINTAQMREIEISSECHSTGMNGP